MKRLAFALAAAVLGAGCHSSTPPPPPSGTLDLSWEFIRTVNDANATQVPYHCNTPGLGIDTVVVSANGVPSPPLPCNDGAGDGAGVALAPGTYTIDVTAYRGGAGGVALFSHRFPTVNIFVNAVTQLGTPQNPVSLEASFDSLQINVLFIDLIGNQFVPNACATAGVDKYSFHLVDSAGTSVYSSGDIPCFDPPGILFNNGSAAGPVDLDAYTIRVLATNFPATPTFDFDSAIVPTCSSPVFHHYGHDVGAFSWNLPVYDVTGLPPSQLCP